MSFWASNNIASKFFGAHLEKSNHGYQKKSLEKEIREEICKEDQEEF